MKAKKLKKNYSHIWLPSLLGRPTHADPFVNGRKSQHADECFLSNIAIAASTVAFAVNAARTERCGGSVVASVIVIADSLILSVSVLEVSSVAAAAAVSAAITKVFFMSIAISMSGLRMFVATFITVITLMLVRVGVCSNFSGMFVVSNRLDIISLSENVAVRAH